LPLLCDDGDGCPRGTRSRNRMLVMCRNMVGHLAASIVSGVEAPSN